MTNDGWRVRNRGLAGGLAPAGSPRRRTARVHRRPSVAARHASVVALAACWLAGFAGSSSAGGEPAAVREGAEGPPALREGLPVERILVQGCRLVDPTVVEGQIRLRVGDPYTEAQVQADTKRILALDLFTNVKVEVGTNREGVVITYTVTEKQRVEQVVFRGNERFSEGELLKVADLAGVAWVDDFRLMRAARQIEERYRERGYPFVAVTSAYETVEGTPAAVITVREGPHVRVRAIEFTGVTAFSHPTLRTLMETKSYLLVFRRGIFNEATVKEDVRRVRDRYVEEGYLDAEVDYELSFNAERSRVTVQVHVREGEPFTVGTVEVRGAKVFSAEEVAQQMTLREGARYTAAALAADRQAIERMYGRLGYYRTTRVDAQTQFAQAPHVVNIRIDVVEGERIRLAAIRVEGNTKTRTDIILREITLEPGKVLDGDALEESRRRLNRLRYFSSVTMDRLEGPRPDEKDLVVEVTEDRTANIILGVGVGTETGLLGSISYVQRNFDIARLPRSWEDMVEGYAFAGAGQTFRLVAQPGTELQEYAVEFGEPHLLGTDFTLDVRGFLYERSREDYDEGRAGGRVAVGRRLTEFLSAEVAFRAEQIDIGDVGADAPPDVLEVAGTSVLTSIGLSVTHDTRDDWLDPTRGHRYSAGVEQAGAMGGDYDFTRFIVRAGWHVPVWQGADRAAAHVVSVGGRLGYILGDAPIFERFYAGGTYTMRGFDYRGVGPHAAGEPVGGDFLAVASAEYSLPLVENVLRGVVFLDVGSVEKDFGFGTLRVSAGFGLRIYLGALGPAPMQFNFGFPLAKGDEDDTQVFSFAVGTQL